MAACLFILAESIKKNYALNVKNVENIFGFRIELELMTPISDNAKYYLEKYIVIEVSGDVFMICIARHYITDPTADWLLVTY